MNNKDYKNIANHNEVSDNISVSLIKFPRRYTNKKDIEVSGIFASWMSYGDREECERMVERLLIDMMDDAPYNYILSREYAKYKDDYTCLYRMTSWHNFAMLCENLYKVYDKYEDLEEAVISNFKSKKYSYYYQSLCDLLCEETLIQGPKSNSTCNRINEFMRWMVRYDSPFDIGKWYNISPRRLMVTCTDKALSNAVKLGIINQETASKANMVKITEFANNIFRNDPARLDYVLNYE